MGPKPRFEWLFDIFGAKKREVELQEKAELQSRVIAAEKAAEEMRQFMEKEPRVDQSFADNKLTVNSYNIAWVDKLRWDLGDLTLNKTDEEIVQLYVDRENLAHEEPYLKVEHMGIDEETGKIKMKLDWNQAFVKLLRDNAGIVAENEEEAIQAYLLRLTMDVSEDLGFPSELTMSRDEIKAQMEQVAIDLSGDYEKEMAEAEEMARKIAKSRKPIRRRKVNRTGGN
jgi:hypothetical protein